MNILDAPIDPFLHRHTVQRPEKVNLGKNRADGAIDRVRCKAVYRLSFNSIKRDAFRAICLDATDITRKKVTISQLLGYFNKDSLFCEHDRMYVRCVDVTKFCTRIVKNHRRMPFFNRRVWNYLSWQFDFESNDLWKESLQWKGHSVIRVYVTVMFHDNLYISYISYISFQFLLDTFCSVAYVRCIIKFKNTIVIYSLKHISPLYGSDSK